jgi:hypothetical protein
MAVPAALCHLREIDAAPGRYRQTQAHGGAARGVHFLTVMHLHDLGIVQFSRQSGSHAARQLQQKGSARGEVRGVDHGHLSRRFGHRRFIGCGKARGTQDPGSACGSQHRRMAGNGMSMGEVDHRIGHCSQRSQVGQDRAVRGWRAGPAGAT